MECEYCKRDFRTENYVIAHQKRCIAKKAKDLLITNETLIDMYYNKNMSIVDIFEYYNKEFSLCCLYKLFILWNIPRKSLSVATSTSGCKDKRKKTLKENYGCEHNFEGNSILRKKWEQRLLEEEGITNVFQRDSVKKKSLNTLIEKYGVESPGCILTSRGKNAYSSVHKKVVEILLSLNMDISIEFKLKKIVGLYYSYDIIINNTNKLIEVYGDYWHGNPLIYKESDIILKGSSREMTVLDKWGDDDIKIEYAKNNGFEVLIVWEYDLKHNIEEVINNLKKFIYGTDKD